MKMSRDLNALTPSMLKRAVRFLDICNANDFPVLIYCTLRSPEDQAIEYRKGRTLQQIKRKARQLERVYSRPDLCRTLLAAPPQMARIKTTFAGPGQSLHHYGRAFDGVPLGGGKPIWNAKTPEDKAAWALYGEYAKLAGLDWAGLWPRKKREFPHCQEPGADWRRLI